MPGNPSKGIFILYNMKEIELTQGKVATVDDEDFEYLNQWKWYAQKGGKNYYAVRVCCKSGRKLIYMHRQIMKAQKGQMIDHINSDGLYNRKENLRFCTSAENNKNKKASGVSKYLGVHWHKQANKWQAKIKANGKYIHLGLFSSEIEAALAYDEYAKIHHKEFARLNIIINNLILN